MVSQDMVDSAKEAWTEAADDFVTTKTDAQSQYEEAKDSGLAYDSSFVQWVQQGNYPALMAAFNTVKSEQSRYENMLMQYDMEAGQKWHQNLNAVITAKQHFMREDFSFIVATPEEVDDGQEFLHTAQVNAREENYRNRYGEASR
ncbi:uncharacterized protein N7511_010480 [Penicillium nucicola]|uniref:uncharacterized protein n=1 Tax=Penicillium nucicola TaxID=1850975 RepID=UPI002545552F|nr:uncharacterized protein N7511_010480 [Penicillium nucicola]KAJ5748784.1 hypothetical protein N7511_010480 [Penicillium nucicola]